MSMLLLFFFCGYFSVFAYLELLVVGTSIPWYVRFESHITAGVPTSRTPAVHPYGATSADAGRWSRYYSFWYVVCWT